MADRVIGFVTGGISRGIAITSEAIAGDKGRSSASARRVSEAKRDDEDSESDEDLTEQIWELDEAGDQSTEDRVMPVAVQLCQMCKQEHSVSGVSGIRPIQQSIVIPQRRPGTRSRGFVQAYAPILDEHKCIDQDTFLDFLRNLDKASKASPIFDVVNLACFIGGMIPNEIAFAVTTAVGNVNKIAETLQIRYRSNTYLHEANQNLLQPHGCFAMIMTYKPDMADELLLEVDTTQIDGALHKSLSTSSRTKEILQRFKQSAGTTKESQVPDCAELIYPSLDKALTSTSLTKSSSAGTRAKAVNEYLDQRAQSTFQATNPHSKLSQVAPPQEKQYVNRFADPNHPVNSGSIFGLLSGGSFDPIASGRIRRAEKYARKHGQQPLTDEEKHDAYMGRKVRGRVTGTPSKKLPLVGKMLKNDILYLVIVDLPTERQVADVERKLEMLAK